MFGGLSVILCKSSNHTDTVFYAYFAFAICRSDKAWLTHPTLPLQIIGAPGGTSMLSPLFLFYVYCGCVHVWILTWNSLIAPLSLSLCLSSQTAVVTAAPPSSLPCRKAEDDSSEIWYHACQTGFAKEEELSDGGGGVERWVHCEVSQQLRWLYLYMPDGK